MTDVKGDNIRSSYRQGSAIQGAVQIGYKTMEVEEMMYEIPEKMTGMKLPGGAKVERVEQEVPKPGHGQVLLKMKAASLCGSDLKYIYYEHTDKTGGARYDNVIAGHEPSGQVVMTGEGVCDFKEGDRVVVYHIQGCGYCDECKKGFFINCQQPERRAYGWQRDGALAEYMVADASTCIHLPDFLTYEDGAMIACGFGTAYQGLLRANVSGRERVLVMGLGPVGQAACILAKAMGAEVIGVDIAKERLDMAVKAGADQVFLGDDQVVKNVMEYTGGKGVEVSVDCSGSSIGRHRCLEAARMWGQVVFLGEQGTVTFEPSPLLLHKNLTLHGSWVTSVGNMERLVEFLERKKIHPSQIITHRYPLEETEEAYRVFATGKTGKVCVNME